MRSFYFLLCFLVSSLLSWGQTTLKVTNDTVRVIKAELKLQNSTSDSTGFLFNTGKGSTQFKRIKLINLGDTAIAIPGQDTLSVRFSGGYSLNSPDVSLGVRALEGSNVKLKWWQSDNELYQSARIGVIGDSQGAGSYASTFSNSIVGLLQSYIYSVSPNAAVTNYCKDGYNSRNLAPDGSNSYVDTQRNITKAIADGNTIIILINTSNDYASNSSGGEMTNEEALSNTLLIEDLCKRNGVQLIVMSNFPRQQLGTTQRLKLLTAADNLRKTFGNRCAYVYHLLEDPSNPNQLNSSLQVGDNIHLNDAGCAIVFKALRNTLSAYFTSNTDVIKYVVQRTIGLSTPFSDYQTITSPSQNTLDVAEDGQLYRVRLYFRDGYFSQWSNVAQATKSNNVPVKPLPVISISGPSAITLPTNSITLTATATAPAGSTIASYQWSKISGGNAVIASPTNSETNINSLVQGTYVFRCVVTDSDGGTNSRDITVTVSPTSDPNGAVKFNFNLTAQNVPGWIDVSDGPLASANTGKTWIHTASGIGLLSIGNNSTYWGSVYYGVNAGNDNGEQTSDAGGFATDQPVISSAWYSKDITYSGTSSSQFKLIGLNPAKKYLIRIYSSLDNSFGLDANPTLLIVNDNTLNKRLIDASGNTSDVAIFNGVQPNASGEIPVFVGVPAGEASFGMINGLTITEETTTTNIAPVVDAGNAQTVILPLSSANLRATITGGNAEPVTVLWTKVSGPSATITTANSLTTAVTGLTTGTYIFRCTVTDRNNLTGFSNVTITVSASSNFPTLKVAFSKNAFTSSGWEIVSGEPHNGTLSKTVSYAGNAVTVATGTWTPFVGQYSADATGETVNDGGGFAAPTRVVQGNFFNISSYAIASPQVTVSNLAAGKYRVTFFGSLNTATAQSLSANCNTVYRVNSSDPVTVNNQGNTSKTAVFDNIEVLANGTLNLFATPIQGGVNQYIATLCYFTLEKTE
ncbi:SGNH/GDSL hydrolase family protein [Chitinophaga sp. S165]|uniref:SGNH/GDSL hydrolase family protein n=1 Tax=Chitinophaga sp. S165 TaxID=2135462 RepID=UPI000D8B2CBB|nr:SGNH/GDSL hydrolase family protein [Chitinophaga sp. S165]PWV47115.1 hypothetical protein C7475_109203 [Chitinophaga sp. S165]